ncbi:hypothetical protein PHO31112_05410 [Pandoraea horticolens]|uniref:Uncharacterized protein n=1 Tax=Pandoraea horticolens TaxID=2508298 RepID=A0A5E4ZEA3_9BURK|nr:hypothetical protein PHO31112_05410 [Pandoraea horticolens]
MPNGAVVITEGKARNLGPIVILNGAPQRTGLISSRRGAPIVEIGRRGQAAEVIVKVEACLIPGVLLRGTIGVIDIRVKQSALTIQAVTRFVMEGIGYRDEEGFVRSIAQHMLVSRDVLVGRARIHGHGRDPAQTVIIVSGYAMLGIDLFPQTSGELRILRPRGPAQFIVGSGRIREQARAGTIGVVGAVKGFRPGVGMARIVIRVVRECLAGQTSCLERILRIGECLLGQPMDIG